MSLGSSRFIFALTILVGLLMPAAGLAQDSQVKGATTATVPTSPAAPLATTPAALPSELVQVPEGKADVSYVNGQLVIKAHDAPLIEVVSAVCKAVGAELDAQSWPREPVLGTLGPGSASKVLASLLQDFHVNYAMGGAADNANTLSSLIIFPASKDDRAERVARQAVQDEPSPLPDSSSAAPVSTHEALNQAKELLKAARAELASNTGASSGDRDMFAGMEAAFQQAETQLMAVAASGAHDSSPSQTQQGQAATTASTDSTPSAAPPPEQVKHHTGRHRR